MSASRRRRIGRRIALVSALVALIATACGNHPTLGAIAHHLVPWSEGDLAMEYHYISTGLLDER